MKKFLIRNRKPVMDSSAQGSSSAMDPHNNNNNDLYPINSGGGNRSTYTSESQDSFGDLQPMFTQEDRTADKENSVAVSGTPFINDTNLNLNPTISIAKSSVFTKDSTDYMGGKSIFSKGKMTLSYSTKPSTAPSTAITGDSVGSGSGKKGQLRFGLPLQILELPEDSHGVEIDLQQAIQEKLHQLSEDCSYTINQFNNSLANLSTTVINIIDCLKGFIKFINSSKERSDYKSTEWRFDTYNNIYIRRLMVVYLNLYDNLLTDDAYLKLKLLLTKNFNDFISTLSSSNVKQKNNSQKLNASMSDKGGPYVLQKPQNYAVGINGSQRLPNENVVHSIMGKMASSSASVKEQNGSFIAPILRGLGTSMNVMCLYFAYPNPTEFHYKLAKSLHDLFDEIHIMVVKNKIELAATTIPGPPVTAEPLNGKDNLPSPQPLGDSGRSLPSTFIPQVNYTARFKLPFRVPTDITKPPMSMSISLESTTRVSGTVGGYIYPMINVKTQPHLQSYANSKFAVSCGHVCLDQNGDSGGESIQYPHVSVPSKVVILLYKQALVSQYQKFNSMTTDGISANQMPLVEARAAYSQVIQQVDQMFPPKRVKVVDPRTKQMKYEISNLPIHRFGQIIWGERALIDAGKKKRLSDLAVIKVNRNLICDANFLGDDIPFNEYDQSLMFDNLYVRSIVPLRRAEVAQIDGIDINEIDDEAPVSDMAASNVYDGINVFKYGSTSKFTKGNLNGIKLVYWFDGAIQSSEFIVNSIESNSAFAAGGDSGLWVLTKCEDCPPGSLSESKGLAVLGMLHSYDGEFKQFGLFSPMTEILSRLQAITSIKWGIVGVSPTKKEMAEMGLDYADDEDDLESISGALSMASNATSEVD